MKKKNPTRKKQERKKAKRKGTAKTRQKPTEE